jgi:hypothetical protein
MPCRWRILTCIKEASPETVRFLAATEIDSRDAPGFPSMLPGVIETSGRQNRLNVEGVGHGCMG